MADRAGRLEGKVAIVTGAGSRGPGVGNGKATSVLFAREGAKVLLVDNAIDNAEETRAIIEGEDGEASILEADVTNEADCRAMVETAVERYGRLDILDNNVGISLRKSIIEMDPDEWDQMMTINLKSMMLASRSAIPAMIENGGGGGSIINISSVAALRAIGDAAYTTSKAAVIGLTMTMAADHGRDGVRVNCIAPGLVYTPMVAYRLDEELREHRRKASALGTEGTAWDVAWAAVFLASDEARWITGAVLPVEAGTIIAARDHYTHWWD